MDNGKETIESENGTKLEQDLLKRVLNLEREIYRLTGKDIALPVPPRPPAPGPLLWILTIINLVATAFVAGVVWAKL